MTDVQIPRDAVDRAARAMAAGSPIGPFECMRPAVQHMHRETAMTALNAAALPLLLANLGTDSLLRDDLARSIVRLDAEELHTRIEQEYGPDAEGCGGWTFDGPPCGDCVDCAQMRIAASSNEAFEAARTRAETLLRYVRQAIEWRHNRPAELEQT